MVVSGDFGLTSVAFEILIRELKADSELHQYALAAAFRPEIDFHIVPSLVNIGAVTACMDSSDGLGITLHTMAKQSGCGLVIDNLPVSPEVETFCKDNELDILKIVMQGGEEFLLVLTIPSDMYDKALDVVKKKKIQLKAIGSVAKGDRVVWKSKEGLLDIPNAGYDNFKEWD